MKRIASIAFVFCTFSSLYSDIEIKQVHPITCGIPVKFGGYIKHESFWDTRQVVGAREDQTLLFPEPKDPDIDCNDINAQGQFTSVALQTRMRFEIDGPEIGHATSKGVIEFDFFGREGIANIFRMRHAHIILDWEKAQILAGQAYHPLYVIGVDPRTISFNTGIPLDTFSRNPQFRVTYLPNDHVHLLFCASTQLDFPTDGPIGSSSTYLRDSVIPMLDFRIDTYIGDHRIGAGVDFMRIQPRLKTNMNLKTRERLNNAIAILYADFKWDAIDTRTKLIYAQNATDHNMNGGYAVSCVDTTTDRREYASLNQFAIWNDTQITKSKSVVPGWFIGVAKNLGANKPIIQSITDSEGAEETTIYGQGNDIDYVFRVSPRLEYKINNFTFAVEVEYTRAAYGTISCDGDVIDTCPVGNTRILASLFYYL
jgi:hypothetical protein